MHCRVVASFLAWTLPVVGQTYNVYTVAGGGVPQNTLAASAATSSVTSLAADAAGNIYMALYDYSAIAKMDSDGVLTLVVGTGIAGFSGDGGPAAQAQINEPVGIALDSSGALYIADAGNGRIRKVSAGVITTVAGNGVSGCYSAGPCGDGGPATQTNIEPQGVAVDTAGNLYFTESYDIREVANGIITTIAGAGSNIDRQDGPASEVFLSDPVGLAVGPDGAVYFSQLSTSSCIRKVFNGMVTTVAGICSYGYAMAGDSGDGGPALDAVVSFPTALAFDREGSLYFLDTGGAVVRKVSQGIITTVAGNGIDGYQGDGGPATQAELSLGDAYWLVFDNVLFSPPDTFLSGLAIGLDGALYIGDIGNYRVRKVANGLITTVAGDGTEGLDAGDGGPAQNARLNVPTRVAVSPGGDIYVLDELNNRVRRISNGIITAAAGNGTYGYSGDKGPATEAQLQLANAMTWYGGGIALDGADNLYIADHANNVIRKVSNGIITTVAGNGASGSAGDGVPALSAQLGPPTDVAADASGNFYIPQGTTQGADVREVSNGIISTVAGSQVPILTPVPSVAVDTTGNLYILGTSLANEMDGILSRVSNGIATTLVGGDEGDYTGPNPIGDGGPAVDAFIGPGGVAADPSGNIYIADTGNRRVRKISDGVITTIGGYGVMFSPVFTPLGASSGPATDISMNPVGVAADAAGNIYIADVDSNLVRVLVPVDPSCAFSLSPVSGRPSGVLSISVSTGPSCSWVVTGLPSWMSAQMVHTGPATVGITVHSPPSGVQTARFFVAGIPLSITVDGSCMMGTGGEAPDSLPFRGCLTRRVLVEAP